MRAAPAAGRPGPQTASRRPGAGGAPSRPSRVAPPGGRPRVGRHARLCRLRPEAQGLHQRGELVAGQAGLGGHGRRHAERRAAARARPHLGGDALEDVDPDGEAVEHREPHCQHGLSRDREGRPQHRAARAAATMRSAVEDAQQPRARLARGRLEQVRHEDDDAGRSGRPAAPAPCGRAGPGRGPGCRPRRAAWRPAARPVGRRCPGRRRRGLPARGLPQAGERAETPRDPAVEPAARAAAAPGPGPRRRASDQHQLQPGRQQVAARAQPGHVAPRQRRRRRRRASRLVGSATSSPARRRSTAAPPAAPRPSAAAGRRPARPRRW